MLNKARIGDKFIVIGWRGCYDCDEDVSPSCYWDCVYCADDVVVNFVRPGFASPDTDYSGPPATVPFGTLVEAIGCWPLWVCSSGEYSKEVMVKLKSHDGIVPDGGWVPASRLRSTRYFTSESEWLELRLPHFEQVLESKRKCRSRQQHVPTEDAVRLALLPRPTLLRNTRK